MEALVEHQLSDPVGIADAIYKRYSEVISGVEKVRRMKGRGTPDWPYWCFLPEAYWLMLFMGKRRCQFNRELWFEIRKLQILGTWRYSKGIYSLHPALLDALTETPIVDSLPVEVFFRLPEWCIYVRTPEMQVRGDLLYGFWAMVNHDTVDNRRSLYLLLNGKEGIQTESVVLKPGSIKTLLDEMLCESLDSSGADATIIGLLKQSAYVEEHLKRKSDDISKLLSILLFICSDEPDIDSERQPGAYPVYPKSVKTKKGFRLFPANGSHHWTVGEKMGKMLGLMMDDDLSRIATGRHLRAHLRRGHWHGFWSGKRDGTEDRLFAYRWLPPQIIGGRQG
jgi:hypothetical protein